MHRRGFTLLELAVIIGIVVLLVAILYPATWRPHGDNARRASCQSNLKLISLACKQYQQDYNERFPLAINGQLTDRKSGNWSRQLMPYLTSLEALRCPSDNSAKHKGQVSYSYNAWLGGLAVPKLQYPAHVVLNFDVVADPNDWTQTGTSANNVSASTRHQEGCNYSFADGHVKWFKPNIVKNSPEVKDGPTFVAG